MPIDLKSLYLNIKNDNQTGHTPTVATPLRQGNSIHSEIAQIVNVPQNLSERSFENLSLHLLSNSRVPAKIVKAFLFDKISVNGIPIESNSSYCIYIREETDQGNVHFGRQKVHYPQKLRFEDDEVSVDNYAVISAVSTALHDYAIIVQAFEYCTDTGVLNIDALVVGENNVPYSKVFLNKRGVGDKYTRIFNEYADIYDTEIISMRKMLGYDSVSPDNFMEVMAENKLRALELVEDYFSKHKIKFNAISKQYPYSLYDFEYIECSAKKYAIVRFTSTKIDYFNLSSKSIRFINEFKKQVVLFLISDINGTPIVKTYDTDDLSSMKKTIESVTYEVRSE